MSHKRPIGRRGIDGENFGFTQRVLTLVNASPFIALP